MIMNVYLRRTCPNNTFCANTIGSYNCNCVPGFFFDGIKCAGTSIFFLSNNHCIILLWFVDIIRRE